MIYTYRRPAVIFEFITENPLFPSPQYTKSLTSKRMYIIKVKGKAKIPDYIQLRNEEFILVAYFRADRPLKDLHRYGLEGKEVELANVISGLEFGKLQPLNI